MNSIKDRAAEDMFSTITRYARPVAEYSGPLVHNTPTDYFEYFGRMCVDGVGPDHQLTIRLDSDEVIVVLLNEIYDVDIFELAMLLHQRGELIIKSLSIRFSGTTLALPIPLHRDTDS